MAEANGATLDTHLAGQDDPTAASPVNANYPTSPPTDNGQSKRPRDARLIHLILANYGVNTYQERIPLQLMDFAYRYTSSILQDALHFVSEGYGTTGPGTGSGKAAVQNDMSPVTLSALRLSIASRTHYQFNPTLPKECYNEIAHEKNRVGLPPISKDWGMRLPPEQYCLTGTGWNFRENWDEEDEEIKGVIKEERVEDINGQEVAGEENEGEEGEEGGGRMEDIFGEETNAEGADMRP